MDTSSDLHPMPPNPAVTPSGSADSVPARDGGPNFTKLRVLGGKLMGQFKTYESHRYLQEQKWQRNLRQFLGEYDPDVAKNLDDNRSRAYPRITRIKVISMLSRLMNLLFPSTEKNWTIEASPVPNLEEDDLNTVLQTAQQAAAQAGQQLDDEVIEKAIREFSKTRAANLSLVVEDQLAEVGGSRNLGYVSLCRKVIFSALLYGMGTLKGPFLRKQKARTWTRNAAGNYEAVEYEVNRPQFEFVSAWDYYPDLTARHLHTMDGQFQRIVCNKNRLRELADRPDFFAEEIKAFMRDNPKGNFKEKRHETELRTQGNQQNVNVLAVTKYEIIVWDGFVSSQELSECGIGMPADASELVDASVWMLGDRIIKCVLSPWAELEPDERVQMYHHFIFEEDDSNLIGNGLPNIMRDSQLAVSAATRMMLDNASVICGPGGELNVEYLEPGQDDRTMQPYKIWRRNGQGAEAQIPVFREIKFDSHIGELKEIVEMFVDFAGQETFVNPATGGDMQKGPSEPFRTAAGASMIQGQMALPFKDAVRNFDNFTISTINSLILFNRHFNPDREVQGDHTVIARGASSLVAKEVRGMALDTLAQTVQPEERKYVKWYGLLKERLVVRDVDLRDVVVSEDDAKAVEAEEADKQKEDADQMRELFAAEVRKLLADATKSLTAADANSANADLKQAQSEAAFYDAVLAGLEKGVTPAGMHASHMSGELPPEMMRRKSAEEAAAKKPAPAAVKH